MRWIWIDRILELEKGRRCVAVKNVCVYHMWHPLNPQKRENWSELPGARGGYLPREGLSTAAEQAEVRVERIVAGKPVRTWTFQTMGAAVGAAR